MLHITDRGTLTGGFHMCCVAIVHPADPGKWVSSGGYIGDALDLLNL